MMYPLVHIFISVLINRSHGSHRRDRERERGRERDRERETERERDT